MLHVVHVEGTGCGQVVLRPGDGRGLTGAYDDVAHDHERVARLIDERATATGRPGADRNASFRPAGAG